MDLDVRTGPAAAGRIRAVTFTDVMGRGVNAVCSSGEKEVKRAFTKTSLSLHTVSPE
jgi:hypothetical protein